jgi:predicted patatin/cPLA2 family phospholipase
MVQIYDEIIISSGGVKGIAVLGALNEFAKKYPIYKIKYFTGCSVGAIICLFLNIGYTINELNDIILKINFSIFQEIKILNLIEKCGLDEGIKFTNFLKASIINKGFNNNITFQELYDLTGKVLTICVVNITKGVSEYHNYLTTPTLSVLLSVRMSSNIPVLFSPIMYNDCYYVDGALLDPFPYYFIKNTNKFGLCLFENYQFKFIKEDNVSFVNNLSSSFNYIIELLKIVYTNYIKKYYKKMPKNVVYIDFDYTSLNNETFYVPEEDRFLLFNIGKKKFNNYYKKYNKRIRKRYLIKKYFNIWKNLH